jgi:periplasmic copper chaperone A
MKRLIAIIAFVLAVTPALAQSPGASSITVDAAWARATPGGAKTGVVYLTLANHGADADRLVGASTPVAEKAQLHSEFEANGVMKMRPLAAIEVKPHEKTALKPNGMHLMLIGLKQSLKEGENFPLTSSSREPARWSCRSR